MPAVLLLGPRAVGKTTTAARCCATVIRLDEPAESAAFAADPDAALRGLPEPVLLDEWQYVPSIMGAIKRAVDRDPRPGRFIVAGSANAATFLRGVVLHTGPRAFALGDRLLALPIGAIWSAPAA